MPQPPRASRYKTRNIIQHTDSKIDTDDPPQGPVEPGRPMARLTAPVPHSPPNVGYEEFVHFYVLEPEEVQPQPQVQLQQPQLPQSMMGPGRPGRPGRPPQPSVPLRIQFANEIQLIQSNVKSQAPVQISISPGRSNLKLRHYVPSSPEDAENPGHALLFRLEREDNHPAQGQSPIIQHGLQPVIPPQAQMHYHQGQQLQPLWQMLSPSTQGLPSMAPNSQQFLRLTHARQEISNVAQAQPGQATHFVAIKPKDDRSVQAQPPAQQNPQSAMQPLGQEHYNQPQQLQPVRQSQPQPLSQPLHQDIPKLTQVLRRRTPACPEPLPAPEILLINDNHPTFSQGMRLAMNEVIETLNALTRTLVNYKLIIDGKVEAERITESTNEDQITKPSETLDSNIDAQTDALLQAVEDVDESDNNSDVAMTRGDEVSEDAYYGILPSGQPDEDVISGIELTLRILRTWADD
ncbi:hypothetical protein K470DRAFT_292777 [Piedraia hortae CBS 480.64]|uniref:Uncharacterized protein n=1 Tax=Piedraia hortae CBS 480.64 TaxID=1314780 RepID=A0A6A7C898_9PEZI|nr:hypothetical protein K470DRAFT_292777 [Piedraia hortae CBS 480.64]